MFNKLRNLMKKCYEKNNKSLVILYIISFVILLVSRKYKNLKLEINEAISNHIKNKGNIKKIKKEIILFRIIYKIRPNEYFLYKTSERSVHERSEYISREMTNGYYKRINNFDALVILNDKYLSYRVFKDLYNRDVLYVSSEEDKEEFIKFVKRNNKFVLKPVDGHGGVGINFLSLSDFNDIDELFDHISSSMPFVCEEIVVQNESMACFHPQSLNTVRVVTFQNNGYMSIVWAFFRVGQGDSNVDNMTSGGFGAQVDSESGKIITDGIDYKGDKLKRHPDSNIKFNGYQIPKWNELKSILSKLSAKIPSIHCIGWDMAYTDNGWVLIEANGRPQVVTIQVLTDKGFKPLFDKMVYLCEMKEATDEKK